MERKKFTTTLSVDVIKQLNIIAAIEDNFSGANSVIEFLVKRYVEENGWGGDLNAIKKD